MHFYPSSSRFGHKKAAWLGRRLDLGRWPGKPATAIYTCRFTATW